MNRGTLREKYGINTGDCASGGTDCLMHFFCTPCGQIKRCAPYAHAVSTCTVMLFEMYG
jgi:hypothetical protein